MRIVRNAVAPPPPDRFGWPDLCVLPEAAAEDTPGAEWEEFVEDGLGEARGACVEIEGGWVVSMVRYQLSQEPGYHMWAMTEEANLPDVLAAVLRASDQRVEDLPWVSAATQPFSALRLRALSRASEADACGVDFETPARFPASALVTLTDGGAVAQPDVLRTATEEQARPLLAAIEAFLRAAEPTRASETVLDRSSVVPGIRP